MANVVMLLLAASPVFSADTNTAPAWTRAHLQKPMTVAETKAFMKTLTQYVVDHHLKKDAKSPQRGMIYEYYDVKSKDWVQGEALDTMHDGAWFAVAMVNAYRATGDPFYKEVLTKWQLPFYLKMLNHSDTLFSAKRNDARPGAPPLDKEHLLQEGEKGFVPYFWDDGASVSLDMSVANNPRPVYPAVDFLAGKPNPQFQLDGYSLGCSNHMAQDLAVMLQQSWLLLRESKDTADKQLADEVAEAAKNLHASRLRHHGHIPMVCAAYALTNGDAEDMKRVPDPDDLSYWQPDNHYYRALYDFKPGQRYPFPGFADDQQYRYYYGIARAGGQLTKPLAFKTIYDAYTQRMLYRYYSDDAAVPPGINIFDLHPYYCRDGKPEDYRSDRKGPGGKPRPIGSRFGPQNMVCSGWALETLRQDRGLWDKGQAEKVLPAATEAAVTSQLDRELGGGLRTWEAIFKEYGYIPTGIGAGSAGGGFEWENFSDTGGYAHLISAAEQWIFVLEGKRDWEQHRVPAIAPAK